MSDTNLQALVEGARAYEQLFVPALFGQWATHVLDAARVEAGQSVLDVACGTGTLARKAAEYVGTTGQVTGIDPHPGMLVVAKECSPEVHWREAAAETLPFSDGQYDSVVSQFGLMFFENRTRALAEMYRVLKPAGRMTVAVWDAVENQSGFAVQLELIRRLAGDAAAEASRAPFALGNADDLTALFNESRAKPAKVQTLSGQARFPSIQVMVEAELRGWLPIMGVNLTEETIEAILREAEEQLSCYQSQSGAIKFEVSAHIITSVKSSPTQ